MKKRKENVVKMMIEFRIYVIICLNSIVMFIESLRYNLITILISIKHITLRCGACDVTCSSNSNKIIGFARDSKLAHHFFRVVHLSNVRVHNQLNFGKI